MQKDIKPKWKNVLQKLLKLLGYVMVFFYLIFSSILLLTSTFSATLSPVQRYSVGGMLLVYGIFRAVRIYKSNKESDDEE
jgi:uncharacterized membrane protein HdeD (DUF308 family)